MTTKKKTKKRGADGKKPESFNPAHQQGTANSNYKKKQRTKKNK